MSTKQFLGIVGAVMVAIGVFAPLLTFPVIGNITYFTGGNIKGEGLILLVIAGASLIISLIKLYPLLWLTGLAAIGMIGYTFVKPLYEVSKVTGVDFAAQIFKSLPFQWGIIVLSIGAVLIIFAALIKYRKP